MKVGIFYNVKQKTRSMIDEITLATDDWSMRNWRASEVSETLSGVTNGNRRYNIYIYMVRARHFSSMGRWHVMWEVLSVNHLLKHSNHW